MKGLRTKGKFKKCKEIIFIRNLWPCEIYSSLTLTNTTKNLPKQEKHKS